MNRLKRKQPFVIIWLVCINLKRKMLWLNPIFTFLLSRNIFGKKNIPGSNGNTARARFIISPGAVPNTARLPSTLPLGLSGSYVESLPGLHERP